MVIGCRIERERMHTDWYGTTSGANMHTDSYTYLPRQLPVLPPRPLRLLLELRVEVALAPELFRSADRDEGVHVSRFPGVHLHVCAVFGLDVLDGSEGEELRY